MVVREEHILCGVCGEPTTHYFGNAKSLPVCSNLVCQQATLDEVNLLLELAVLADKENNNEPSI